MCLVALGLPVGAIDVIGAVVVPAAQRQLDHEAGGGKTDDDGSEDERLRQRVGHRSVGQQDGRRGAPQPAHGEDEHVDGVAEERQTEDHWKAAAPQHQVDGARRDPADAGGHEKLHAHGAGLLGVAAGSLLAPAKTDKVSSVDPTTVT